jgi:hypothetical protein
LKSKKGDFIIKNLRFKLMSLMLAVTIMMGTSFYAYASSISDLDINSLNTESLTSFSNIDFVNDSTNDNFEIKTDKLTQTSATISWSSDTLYISYIICRYNVITDEYEEVGATSNTSYTIKNLTQNTSYDYAVKSAVNDTVLGTISFTTKKKPEIKTVKMGLPSVSGSTKTYAYYTAVTAKSSPQYKLLNSDKCYTDDKTGIRMVDGYYCIALGSYYGSTIGTKYIITLSTGKSFKAILCDQKANRHTDSNNQYAVQNKDIVEFYVEKGKIPSNIRGDYGTLEQFKGSIVSIEKII